METKPTAEPITEPPPLPSGLDQILTLDEAAAWLKIKPRELRERVRSGKIPGLRLTNECYRFHPRTIIEKFKRG